MEPTNFNVVRADKENDNRLLSPIECLESVIAEIKSGKRCDSVLVVMLDRGEDGTSYGSEMRACNISEPDMISLLEISKYTVLNS